MDQSQPFVDSYPCHTFPLPYHLVYPYFESGFNFLLASIFFVLFDGLEATFPPGNTSSVDECALRHSMDVPLNPRSRTVVCSGSVWVYPRSVSGKDPFTPSEEGPPVLARGRQGGFVSPRWDGGSLSLLSFLCGVNGLGRSNSPCTREMLGDRVPSPAEHPGGVLPLVLSHPTGVQRAEDPRGGRAPPIGERETGEGGCRSDFRHLGMPPHTRTRDTRQGDACLSATRPSNQQGYERRKGMGRNKKSKPTGARLDRADRGRRRNRTRAPKDKKASQHTKRSTNETGARDGMRIGLQESNDDPSKKVENHLHEHHWVEYKRETKKKPVHGRKKTPFIGTVSGAPTKETENQSLIKPKKKSQAYAFFKSIGCILRGKSYAKAKAKRTHEKVEPTIPVSPVNEMFPPSPSSSEHSGLTNEFHLLDSSITDDSVSSYLNTNAQTREGSQALGGGGEVLTKQLVMAKLENFRSAKMSEFYTCGEDPCIRAAWFLNVEQRSARTESSPPESASNKAYLEPSKKECNKAIDKGTHILMVVPGKPSIVIPKLDLSWTISHTVPVVKKKKGILASFVSKLSPEPAWSPKPKVSLPGLVQSTNQELNLPAPAGLQKNKLHRKRSWH